MIAPCVHMPWPASHAYVGRPYNMPLRCLGGWVGSIENSASELDLVNMVSDLHFRPHVEVDVDNMRTALHSQNIVTVKCKITSAENLTGYWV